MFKSIFLFELKYRLARPATYIYFAILLLAAFGLSCNESVQFGVGSSSNIYRNSPVVVASIMGFINAFAIIIVSAIMSVPVYRDFEHETHHLFFTLPISKFSYLGGRFFGSLVITILIFLGLPLGTMLGGLIGETAGWLESDKMGAFNPVAHLQPFFTIVLPGLLFTGAIFFSLASLSRKMTFSYLGSVLLIVIYIWSQSLLSDLDNKYIASLLDPFGLAAISEITRYWTAFESNNLLVPFSGVLAVNRLIWLMISILIFGFTYRAFKFSSFLNVRKTKLSISDNEYADAGTGYKSIEQSFSTINYLKQTFNLGLIGFKTTIREIPFIAITFTGLVLLIFISTLLQELYGTSIHPVTFALLEKTSGSFNLFVIIIIIFYSGELVWQERRLKMNLIYDALPVPNWLLLGSKAISMFLIIVFLMGVVMISSIGIQLSRGFTDIDFALYIKELFYLKLVIFTLMAVLALLIQTLSPDKFIGHLIVIVYYAWNIIMPFIGLQHNLYKYNNRPAYVYSEMNGYGHMLTAVNWMNLYWALFAILLALVANLFWVRGIDGGFKWKLRLARQRFNRPSKIIFAACLAGFIAVGAFIYYNNNILNKFRTSDESEELAVRYEKTYKRYEKVPQPKVIAAKVFVDIFPYEREVNSKGTLMLKNKSRFQIDSVHIDVSSESELKKLTLGGAGTKVLHDKEFGYLIYKLSKPLLPGDSIPMDFELSYKIKGFPNSGSNTSVVYNGTFVNNSLVCPSIGYNADGELEDRSKRKKRGLKPKDRMAPVNDSIARMTTYISSDGDWIDFEATVSTSDDQIAIAPGYLQKEWTVGDRKYFHYKMDSKILNFYSFLSARYEVKKDKWKDIDLEIYYHKGHEYNLDKMMKAMKVSLEYYTTNFSPYQHRQVRIIEFPRYASFAQSFPNTIPYSESIGFIANLENEDDIDYVNYVTAHEVAHQWWAHQVIGGNVQGATVMSETMSQYSSLMVMEKEYGKDKMRRFLKYELDQYLLNRRFETRKELPLILCENQQYIHYQKGSVVMYALKDYIGEENLNRALAGYIKQVGFQNAPFTNSLEFLSFIRQETPDSLQYILKDMFETITLYSNKTDEVSYTKTKEGKYKVKITVDSRKFRADSVGTEQEIAFNDYIDIGVIGEEKINNKVKDKTLYLKKYKVTKGKNTFEILVNEEPKKAGIDIYNKLIDRDSDDNIKKANLAS